jgi:hypothetical protein
VADIFISYARDDDLPTPHKPDRKGFVTFLDDAVRYEFKELGPERPKIWRDTKRIADGDQFTPEIEEALKSASFLLVVLSPNWMASHWCRRELDTFAKYHGPGGLREHIVVVAKRHVDPDKRPSLLQGQNGFRFYVRNEDPEETQVTFFDRGDPRTRGMKDLGPSPIVKAASRPALLTPPCRTIFVAKPASDMASMTPRLELIGKVTCSRTNGGHSTRPGG